MDIVDRIQMTLDKKGMTIKALEKEIGIGNGTIKRWKTSSPQCNKLQLVANYLHISIEWLITGKNINIELSDNEKELLTYYKLLPEISQRDYLSEIKGAAKMYSNLSEKSSDIKTG